MVATILTRPRLFRSNRGTRISYDALHYQWAKLCQVTDATMRKR